MEHKHEGQIVDGLIKCRICGQPLPFFEETISKVVSALRAKRILDEIAVAGNYQAIGFSGEFVIYSKYKDGIVEEITATKLGERDFAVTKKTISSEGVQQ